MNLRFKHLREAAELSVAQVLNILFFIDESALQASSGGCRTLRGAGAEYTVFY